MRSNAGMTNRQVDVNRSMFRNSVVTGGAGFFTVHVTPLPARGLWLTVSLFSPSSMVLTFSSFLCTWRMIIVASCH